MRNLHLLLLAFGALVALAFMAFAVSIAWVRFWRRRLSLPEGFDEVIESRTPDGATVVLGRLRPRGAPSALPPVVLCHGLAMNRHALALDPQRSLAQRLANLGRDCWLVELRGAAPGPYDVPTRAATFDTYLTQDIPTVLAQVKAATDAESVDWVGFSMGGMLAYAHLGAMRGDGVRRLVTIGSPVRFANRQAQRFAGAAPYLLTPFGVTLFAPFAFLAGGVAPLMRPGLPLAITWGLRGHHYEPATLRRVLAMAFSDVPAGVIKQFARWIRDDSFTSEDGTHDYREGLAMVRVPALVIAGDRDRLATPAAAREAHDRIGSGEKRFLEVGPASGAKAHYDHLDLILGGDAGDDVFPSVVEWLQKA